MRLLINLLPSLTKRFVEISISANLSSYMFYYLYVSSSDMGLNFKHGDPIELQVLFMASCQVVLFAHGFICLASGLGAQHAFQVTQLISCCSFDC